MRKEKKSVATRARILDAANSVLRDKGYFSTRLSDIAKAAGTHAGAMYYYFESKDALVEELLNRNASRSWRYVEQQLANLPEATSYRERVLVAARAALSNQLGESSDETIVHMQLLNQIPAQMRARLMSHATISRRFIRDLIRNGQAAGEFRSDVNPTVVALMLLSNLVWSHDWFRPSADHSIDELAQDLCHILLTGIDRRDAPHHPVVAAKRRARPQGPRGAAERKRRPKAVDLDKI